MVNINGVGINLMRNFLAVVLIVTTSVSYASPCDGIDRTIVIDRAVSAEIAKQLHVSKVDVLQSFRNDAWSIIYINTHETDNAFLFYSRSPLVGHYITLWSGAASKDEEQEIADWVFHNAPGIPSKLAKCFAWHVTNNRDK